MNAHELKTMMYRKLILKTIRDDFNGLAESQKAIAVAVTGCESSSCVIRNLKWLVENGYLILERTGWKKAYTLTEKVA